MKQPKKIVIAGAGIAGLTAALAFAAKGFDVRVFERAEKLEEVGAGLQLSPNATRLFDCLGVLDLLRPLAVQPVAIVLRKAATLKDLARVPLGEAAERRWEAPYLVAHRADVQAALMEKVLQVRVIELVTGATFETISVAHSAMSVSVNSGAGALSVETGLLVGADGVWSATRRFVNPAAGSQFSGELAWRTTISSNSEGGRMLSKIGASGCRYRLPASWRSSDRLSHPRRQSLQPRRLHTGRTCCRRVVRQGGDRQSPQCYARSSYGTDSTAAVVRAVGPMAGPFRRCFRAVDPRGTDRADRRRRPCDDAICGAGCCNGDRGRGNVGGGSLGCAGQSSGCTCSVGSGPPFARPTRRAARRNQPLCLACARSGRACSRSVPESPLAGCSRRRHGLALRLEAGRIASIVQRQRQRQCFRQRVPPTGPQPGFAQSPGGPGVATEQRGE